MYTIQANPSGTRCIEVSNENLRTIEKYALFRHLIDSTGIVDESVLDKLKLNIRSLIASQEEDSKDLLDLCIDVAIQNPNGLNIILIDGVEKLATDLREKLYQKCKNKGLQFIATRTTDDTAMTVVEL